MSAESKRNFKQKRKIAEVLNFLYYATIFPFIFHNIFKLVYYQFSRPKFVKLSSQFKEVGEPGTINKTFNLTYGAYSENRKVLQKIPSSEKETTKNNDEHWFAKGQAYTHTIREIATTGVFQLLSGKEHAAKYRLMKDEKTGDIYSISKLLKNFQPAAKFLFSNYKFTDDESYGRAKNTKYYDATMETTKDLVGYDEMLAITLLLGRYDCGANNWGIIKNRDNTLAATLDYGEATTWDVPSNIERLLGSFNQHCHERIVTPKFLTACEKIIEKFEANYDQIEKELLKGIEAAEAVYPWWGWGHIPTVNDVMRTLTTNKRALKHLCHHIRAELAIANNDANALQTSLKKLDPTYQFPVLSSQSKTTFSFRQRNFKDLIEGGYNQVFLSPALLPKDSGQRKRRIKDAVYLEKTDTGGIWMFLGQHQYEFEKLTEDQCSKIQNLVQALEIQEEENKLTEITTPVYVQRILEICRLSKKKDPDTQHTLNQVLQNYSSPNGSR